MLKKLRSQLLWIVLVFALVIPTASAQAQTSGNLLRNGDFEEGDYLSGWAFQDNIPEVQVAPGWRAFYADVPPDYATKPARCSQEGNGCYWARPEFRDNKAAEFAYRVQSGLKSQKYFTFGRQHEAGLMQQVAGIEPGTKLHFQAFVQLWSCMAGELWSVCPTMPYSNSPAPMHARVGIDPTGGTNPWAGTVIWAGENNTVDTWLLLQVDAVAQADKVTVFVYTRADWTDMIPRIHNDVYIDNASLVSTGMAAKTTTKTTTTTKTGTTSTAKFNPGPIPEGATVYVAIEKDSLSKIAKKNGITLALLRQFNVGRIRPNDIVVVGDKFIVGGIDPASIPTPQPTATPAKSSSTTTTTAPFNPGPIPEGATVYVAVSGDSLSKIAKKNGITLAQLRQYNVGRIRANDVVEIGDKFIVGGVIPTSTPAPAATATPTAATTTTTTTTSTSESGAKFKPAPIPAGSTVYVAAAGDTLSSIAKKFSLTLTRLRELNVGRIRPDDSVWVGDQLVVGP